MTLKYGQLVCDTGGNVGDDIQAIAASLHLPRVDARIERDSIHRNQGTDPVALIMNGWFSGNNAAWPPAPAIRPIFVSFHIAKKFKPVVAAHVQYLKQFEPIGTRDEATAEFLRSIGVQAQTTYCMTLTFPQRETPPKDGKVFLVDADAIAVPRTLRAGAGKMGHAVAPIGHEVTLPYGQRLLDVYRETASLVITTRLHAALPCIAMGIPVIYFGSKSEARTSIISAVGGTIYDARLHRKTNIRGLVGRYAEPVDWSPKPLDITRFKQALRSAVEQRLATIQRTEVA